MTMNVSKDGASTMFLDNLCQRFTALTAKNFLLISHLNQPILQSCLLQPFHSTTGLLAMGRKIVLCSGSHYSQEHKCWGPSQLLHSSVPQESCSVEPQLPQTCKPPEALEQTSPANPRGPLQLGWGPSANSKHNLSCLSSLVPC